MSGQHAVYKGRFPIEVDFRQPKLLRGLVTSISRSLDGY